MVAFGLACSLAACRDRARPASLSAATTPVVMTELALDGMPEERATVGLVDDAESLADVVASIDAIGRDPARRGLFLRIGPLGRGFARAEELASALGRLRAVHEPVHCHFDVADNLAYYVMARGCDRIAMTPAGHLATVGVSAHLYSVHGLLEWAGIRAEFSQAGSDKGAQDPFVLDEPSPGHRASVTSLVEALQARLAEPIVARGGATSFAEAPFDSDRAKERHLIDAIEFDDEARERARRAAGATRVVPRSRTSPPRSIGELAERLLASREEDAVDRPHIVVAYLTGPIVDGGASSSSSTAADPFVDAMRRFARAPNVRAVVLRIDSPGGSALASDRMWHSVARLSRSKPVIVSVGDMAASGGYYVAVAGSAILAEPSSIVGSIGVVAGRPDLGPVLERFGVRFTPIVGAPSADVFTPFRGLRPDERVRFDASIQAAYARFVDRVHTGRRIEASAVAATEGGVYTGARARDLGLVDALGGLDDALARARRDARLPDDAPFVVWPQATSFLESLLGGGTEEVSAAPLDRIDPALGRMLAATAIALEGAPFPRAALPYGLEIR